MTFDERVQFIQWRNLHQFRLAEAWARHGEPCGFPEFCERAWADIMMIEELENLGTERQALCE